VATGISLADGELMGIAGLWSWWRSVQGDTVWSFTMLTINADGHPLMGHLHRPNEEKRMVVILPPGAYDDWLDAPAARSQDFLRPFAADRLIATTDA